MKLLLLAVAVPSLLASSLMPSIATDDKLKLQLTDLREVRELIIQKPADDDNNFGMMQDEPGLFLTFRFETADGLQVLEIRQPNTVEATDSQGNDLTDIEEGFSGEKEYVEVGMTFDNEPPTEMTFHLSTTARAAESFSLKANLEATIFASTEERTFQVNQDWIDVDAGILGNDAARMKFGKSSGMFGESIGLTIRSGTAKDVIQDVVVTIDGKEHESSMSVWSDDEITYAFDEEIAEDAAAELTLTVRTELQIVPIIVEIKDQELP